MPLSILVSFLTCYVCVLEPNARRYDNLGFDMSFSMV